MKSKRDAFSLIELLAATALAALLMLAALQVLRSIRLPTAAAREEQRHIATPNVVELLRWDVAQAVKMRQDGDGLLLAGFGSIDPVSQQPTQRPAVVRYSLRNDGGITWLVREQRGLDDPNHADDATELVAAGAVGLRLDPVDVPRKPGKKPAFNTSAGGAMVFRSLYGMSPMPQAVRLELTLQDQPPITTTVFTR